ncbi:hypothetical protein CLV30_11256 [Haloactinopolyspora alba]|uniref:Uncharacterized protein n=1 Tax=Haloactinopolyspora alba TaxID=648780 RepID=A0A2P8DXB7_9ACTN|nr:hypothetical protein [Haloactinopolyspora alba]PSL01817.1 hypothetical protein CLV30_11256 [Haloactinopolyspora alba]
MGVSESRAAVAEAITGLDAAVVELRRQYGDTLGVRRLMTDTARLADDLDELGDPLPGQRSGTQERQHLEVVPDDPYDPSMWADAEDEGLGAPDRRAP